MTRVDMVPIWIALGAYLLFLYGCWRFLSPPREKWTVPKPGDKPDPHPSGAPTIPLSEEERAMFTKLIMQTGWTPELDDE